MPALQVHEPDVFQTMLQVLPSQVQLLESVHVSVQLPVVDSHLASHVSDPLHVRYSAAAAYASGTSPWRAHAYELSHRGAALAGVELRHPFDDRRVIELLMSMPPEMRRRGDESKRIVRRAMIGLLPDSVRLRRTKAEFSHEAAAGVGRVLDALGAAAGDRPLAIAERGWVAPDELARACRDVRSGARKGRILIAVWMAIGLELWLRETEGLILWRNPARHVSMKG